MKGESRGDITRRTFNEANHFSGVGAQQGRVPLEADVNEQSDIQQHRLQSLAKDLIGPYGVPAEDDGTAGDGFKLVPTVSNLPQASDGKDLQILAGHYYVDGILCENEACLYKSQPDLPSPKELEPNTTYLVYLDVWERHLTYAEADDPSGHVPSIRESALGGPDTATRTKVVWQVKVTDHLPNGVIATNATWDTIKDQWDAFKKQQQPDNRGLLLADVAKGNTGSSGPCAVPPDARYRGLENQLYRVEVHKPGPAGTATFKWSRENASVIFPIRNVSNNTLTLECLAADSRHGLRPGDWVEVVDDDRALRNLATPLVQIESVDPGEQTVTLKSGGPTVGDKTKHPLLRRWDQRKNPTCEPTPDGIAIKESGAGWVDLEDGVQIQFQPALNGVPHQYRTGDHWSFPARVPSRRVEWPFTDGKPHGVEHHYAPLWIISVDAAGKITAPASGDCRRQIAGRATSAVTGSTPLRAASASVPFVFDASSADVIERTVPLAFLPRLILATADVGADFDGEIRSQSVSAVATTSGWNPGTGTDIAVSGAAIEVTYRSSLEIETSRGFSNGPLLFYALFHDVHLSPRRMEAVSVTIYSVDNSGFKLRSERAGQAPGAPQRFGRFAIRLDFHCLG